MIWRLAPLGVAEIFSSKPLGLAVAADSAVDVDLAGFGDLVGLAFRPSVRLPARHQP